MRPFARIFGGTSPMIHPEEPVFKGSLPRREWFETRNGWASRERNCVTLDDTSKKIAKLVRGMTIDEIDTLRKELSSDFGLLLTQSEKQSCQK